MLTFQFDSLSKPVDPICKRTFFRAFPACGGSGFSLYLLRAQQDTASIPNAGSKGNAKIIPKKILYRKLSNVTFETKIALKSYKNT